MFNIDIFRERACLLGVKCSNRVLNPLHPKPSLLSGVRLYSYAECDCYSSSVCPSVSHASVVSSC